MRRLVASALQRWYRQRHQIRKYRVVLAHGYLATTAAGAGTTGGRAAWACAHAVTADAAAAAGTAPTQWHGRAHVCEALRPGTLPWSAAIMQLCGMDPSKLT